MTQAEAHSMAAVPEVVIHDSEIVYGPELDSRVAESPGRGSDDAWCSTPGAEGQHAYATRMRGGSLVTVDRCYSCGHINFGDLDRQVREREDGLAKLTELMYGLLCGAVPSYGPGSAEYTVWRKKFSQAQGGWRRYQSRTVSKEGT